MWLRFECFRDLCYVSYGVENDNREVVAAFCLHTVPNVPAISPTFYCDWLQSIYVMDRSYIQNTLWIHCLLYHPRYTFTCLRVLLEGAFRSQWRLESIMMVLVPTNKCPLWLEKVGFRITPKGKTRQNRVSCSKTKQNFQADTTRRKCNVCTSSPGHTSSKSIK